MDIWDSLIQEPVPENFDLILNHSNNVNSENKYSVISISDKPLENQNSTLSVLIKRDFLVPVTDYSDIVDDITLDEISDYRLMNINEIELPYKAIKVNGMYVSNNSYPLKKEKYLNVKFKSNKDMRKEVKRDIIKWVHRITADRDQYIDPDPSVYWIGGVGDIMLERGVDNLLMSGKIDEVFSTTLPILKSQDLLIGNLEGAVSDRGTKNPKSFTFRFKHETLKYMREAGFDYFGVSNNHIYDFGEIGFKDTLINLEKYNIGYSGAGLTVDDAVDYYEKDGVRVLAIGAFPKERNGYDGFEQSSVNKNRPGIVFKGDLADTAVKSMCSDESFDILLVHGGREWASEPSEAQEELYRSYIDMGVDLVLGSHPHVLQRLEVWNDGLICYSLGNFIFPLMKGWYTGEETIIASFGLVNNKIVYHNIVPVQIDNKTISVDESNKIRERFYELFVP